MTMTNKIIGEANVVTAVSRSAYSGGNRIRVQSFGGGVQSVALLHKWIDGVVGSRPDIVIFADTQDEPTSVYNTVEHSKMVCEQAGIQFVTVTKGKLSDCAETNSIHVPLYTSNSEPMEGKKAVRWDDDGNELEWIETVIPVGGRKGVLFRTCTERFKIRVIRKYLRSLGVKSAEIWLGISTDEASRMKDSNVKWITNRYPLIEMEMSRADCEKYLQSIGVKASRSACVFCPYRSDWSAIRAVKEDWDRAVAYDERIRNVRPGFLSYISSQRKPLVDVKDKVQEPNLFENECEGHCGL